jgi:hypothetical protein
MTTTPGMLYPPAEDTCSRSPLTPPVHVRAFPYDDPCRACVYCGAIPPLRRTTPGAILAAQPGAGDADTAGTETDRGTGVGGPHERPQADGLTPIQLITRPLVLAWGTRHNRDHIREIAEHIDAELRPVHYREAADSLDKLAAARLAVAPDAIAYARAEGIRIAAEIVASTARDLTEGDTA